MAMDQGHTLVKCFSRVELYYAYWYRDPYNMLNASYNF